MTGRQAMAKWKALTPGQRAGVQRTLRERLKNERIWLRDALTSPMRDAGDSKYANECRPAVEAMRVAIAVLRARGRGAGK